MFCWRGRKSLASTFGDCLELVNASAVVSHYGRSSPSKANVLTLGGGTDGMRRVRGSAAARCSDPEAHFIRNQAGVARAQAQDTELALAPQLRSQRSLGRVVGPAEACRQLLA